VIPSPSQSLIELGPITIHFYALCIIAGVAAAVFIGNKRYVISGGASGVVGDVAIYAVPAGIIGGRLYHVATSPQRYFGEGGKPIEALYIWQGGLGIWGAISLGTLIAYLAYRRINKNQEISFSIFADALAPGLLIAQAIGRIGNWFNIELFGRPLDAFWALQVPLRYRPSGYSQFETFHPTFLYESIWCLLAALVIFKWKIFKNLRSGSVFISYVALYSLGRLWIESLRIDDANLIFGLRLNIWTSLVLIGISILLLWRRNFQRPTASKIKN
jgi:prolipoprotein diacylglyceryl transferase